MKTKALLLITLTLSLTACRGGEGSSLSANILTNGFVYGDNFYLPPDREVYEYTCRAGSASPDMLPDIVDSCFGEGEYQRGKEIITVAYEGDDSFNDYLWGENAEYPKTVQLFEGGYLLISDPDKENEERKLNDYNVPEDIVYCTDFQSEYVTTRTGEYSLDEFSQRAYERILPIARVLSPDIDVRAVFARRFKWVSDGTQCVEIEFALVVDDKECLMRSSYCDELDLISVNGSSVKTDALCPSFIVTMFDIDRVYGITGQYVSGHMSKMNQDSAVSMISCEQALARASEAAGSKASHMTLEYAALQYTSSEKTNDTYTLTPIWAIYYKDDEGECGVFYIDRQGKNIYTAPVVIA